MGVTWGEFTIVAFGGVFLAFTVGVVLLVVSVAKLCGEVTVGEVDAFGTVLVLVPVAWSWGEVAYEELAELTGVEWVFTGW